MEDNGFGEEPKGAREKPGLKERKKTIIILFVLLGVVALAAFYLYPKLKVPDKEILDMSMARDLGGVRVRGDGLPGYDIDRDGKADYISFGFGHFKELYASGGFNYGPGSIELKKSEINITLPPLDFKAEEIAESSVGSVVTFYAVDVNSTISSRVIYKTLGPSLNTYTVVMDNVDGGSYIIYDTIGENGSGTIEEREIEIVGRSKDLNVVAPPKT